MHLDKKTARVARAICFAAGSEYTSEHKNCVMCDPDAKTLNSSNCTMVHQFWREALAAQRAIKGL